jgi:hypothetical protein
LQKNQGPRHDRPFGKKEIAERTKAALSAALSMPPTPQAKPKRQQSGGYRKSRLNSRFGRSTSPPLVSAFVGETLAADALQGFFAALEYREVAFDGVGRHFTASILLLVVRHALMGGELAADGRIDAVFVGV